MRAPTTIRATLAVGYAGTALLALATLPIMFSVANRRVGALLCAMTLTVLFIASLTLDGLGWRYTFAARAARIREVVRAWLRSSPGGRVAGRASSKLVASAFHPKRTSPTAMNRVML